MSLKSLISNAFAICCAFLIGAAVYFNPLCADDLCFTNANYEYVHDQSDHIDLEAMWHQAVDDHLHHNGRFGDRISIPILTISPHWLFACVCAYMAWLTFLMASKLSANGDKRPYAFLLSTTLFMLFFPWCDHLSIGCFNINYLWPTALSLLCVYLFLKTEIVARMSILLKSVVFLLFVFAAPIHEQASVTVGLAMTAIILADVLKLNFTSASFRYRLALFCFWTAGSLIWITSPAVFNRSGDMGLMYAIFSAFSHFGSLPTFCAVPSVSFLILGFGAACVYTKKFGWKIWDKIGDNYSASLLSVCFIISGLNLWFYLGFVNLRILSLGCAFSIVGLLVLADKILSEKKIQAWFKRLVGLFGPKHSELDWVSRIQWRRLGASVFCTIMAFFIFATYTNQIKLQIELGHEYHRLMRLYGRSARGLVAAKFTTGPGLRNRPWEIANTDQWLNPYNLYLSRQYYFNNPMPHPLRLILSDTLSPSDVNVVTEKDLEGFPIDTLTGCKLIKISQTIDSPKGKAYNFHATAVPFRFSELCETDNDSLYYYILPHYDSRHKTNTHSPIRIIRQE